MPRERDGGALGGEWKEHGPRTDLGMSNPWTRHQLRDLDEFLSLPLLYLKKWNKVHSAFYTWLLRISSRIMDVKLL